MAETRSAGRGRLRRLRRRLGLGLVTGAAVTALVLALRPTWPLRVAELKTYDARVRWLHDAARADTSIVIVAVDDNSLKIFRDQLGRWPWPREVYAAMLDYLSHAGAKLAASDILFYEPDLRNADGDAALVQATADFGRLVLPVSFSRGDAEREAFLTARLGLQEFAGMIRGHAAAPAPRDAAPDLLWDHIEGPFEALGRPAAALGSVNFNPDPEDGVARRDRLVYAYDGGLYPSLALAAARVADPGRFAGPLRVDADRITVGATEIPLDDGRFLIRWRGGYHDDGRHTYRVVPAYALLNSYQALRTGAGTPEVPPESLRGKVVFLALTGVGLFEARATPLEPHDPGVMIHASVLDNLLRGDFLRAAPLWADIGIVAITALATGAVVASAGSALVATLGALALLAFAALAAALAFQAGVWLELASGLLAGALAFAVAMAVNYMSEGREKRRVRDMFSRYVAPEYVRQLADEFENLRLGGERVPLTLLFSDIRGFTAISEKLPAERVVAMLNEYLERMTEVVFQHGGTLDKFIGDAVMAFWGAPVPMPDHARRAVAAGLDMLEELRKLNERWAAAGATSRLSIGIGVNTGEAIVGNIGSLSHKLDYTAIGDTVNLASRLEALNKEYGTSMIISESTRAAIGEEFAVRPLDEVTVKGKEQAVKIYELTGRRQSRASTAVAAAARASLMTLLLLATVAGGALAQAGARARWTDKVYQPGTWRGQQLAGFSTTNPATDTLALVAMVDGYAVPPMWRMDVRRLVRPDSMAPTVSLVGDGTTVVVLTGVGSTPLEGHALANDSLIRTLVGRFDTQGRPTHTRGRTAAAGARGRVDWVLIRYPHIRTDFADALLNTGTMSRLGRALARVTAEQVGGARSGEVVATAGARGVATVKTPAGEITVMPDTAAILGMQRIQVSAIEIDRFMRDARLTPPAGPARPEGEE